MAEAVTSHWGRWDVLLIRMVGHLMRRQWIARQTGCEPLEPLDDALESIFEAKRLMRRSMKREV